MFEDISKPLKGKGKEKDVGKRRAYVRVVTSLGGASLNLELYCEKVRVRQYEQPKPLSHRELQAPKTCYNFLMLARTGKYNDVVFHRLVPGFMVKYSHLRCHDTGLNTSLRFKQVTLRARALEASHFGVHPSEMNTI